MLMLFEVWIVALQSQHEGCSFLVDEERMKWLSIKALTSTVKTSSAGLINKIIDLFYHFPLSKKRASRY